MATTHILWVHVADVWNTRIVTDINEAVGYLGDRAIGGAWLEAITDGRGVVVADTERLRELAAELRDRRELNRNRKLTVQPTNTHDLWLQRPDGGWFTPWWGGRNADSPPPESYPEVKALPADRWQVLPIGQTPEES